MPCGRTTLERGIAEKIQHRARLLFRQMPLPVVECDDLFGGHFGRDAAGRVQEYEVLPRGNNTTTSAGWSRKS